MKKHHEHLKERASKTRGKGSQEKGSSIKKVDPNDLGDPRGSRAPRGDMPVEKNEKGDKRRPYRGK